MSIYKKERRFFVDKDNEIINNHLVCIICSEVFHKPVRIECGHTFCKKCIIDWSYKRSSNKQCPHCRNKIDTKKDF